MEYLYLILKCLIAVLLGILLGNSLVYVFNHIPGKWLVDYGETPDEELEHPTVQRLKSTPWKYVFSIFFIFLGILLFVRNILYAIPVLLASWLLTIMAVSDRKYMVVPDQFIILLLVTSVGFVPFVDLKSMLYGAGLGFGVLLLMALVSRLIYKKPGIGGADVKLFSVLGFMTGLRGIIIIFIFSTFLSAIHFTVLLALKKTTLKEHRPMVPYISASAIIYLVLFILLPAGL